MFKDKKRRTVVKLDNNYREEKIQEIVVINN